MWLHEVLDAKGEPHWGLCFAHPTRIQLPRKRGYFTGLLYRVTLPNSILPTRPIRAMVEEDRVVEAEHWEIVQNWMGFVNEGVEPLADLLPEHIVKKNGRP